MRTWLNYSVTRCFHKMGRTKVATMVIVTKPKDSVLSSIIETVRKTLSLSHSFKPEIFDSDYRTAAVFRLKKYITTQNHDDYFELIRELCRNFSITTLTGTTNMIQEGSEIYYSYCYGIFTSENKLKQLDLYDVQEINGKLLIITKKALKDVSDMQMLKYAKLRAIYKSDESRSYAKGSVVIWNDNGSKYAVVRFGRYGALLQSLLFDIETDDELEISKEIRIKAKEIGWNIGDVHYDWT